MKPIVALSALLLCASVTLAQDPGLPLDVGRAAPAAAEAAQATPQTASDAALRRIQVLDGFLSEQNILWLSVPEARRSGRARVLYHLAQQQQRWLDALAPETLPGRLLKPLFFARDVARELARDFADGVPQLGRRGRLRGLEDRLSGRPTVRESQPGEPEERLERVAIFGDLFRDLLPALEFATRAHRVAVRAALDELIALQERELDLVSGFDLGPAGAVLQARVAVLRAGVEALRGQLPE